MYTWWLRIFACDFALIGLCIGRFVCKIIPPQPQFAHIHLSCVHLLQSISSTQQKQTKRVGQGRGVCHPFAKNSRQPPYPCFCLISLASTTDNFIYEVRSRDIPHLSCSSLLTSGSSMLIYPSRLARESYLVLADVPLPIAATQQHSAYIWLTYRLSKCAGTFTNSQHQLAYHTIKQAIMHSKVAARRKA